MDLDWTYDIDSKRCTSQCVFMMFAGDLNWMTKYQNIVTLFMIESKYIVSNNYFKEPIWLRKLCSNLGLDVGMITIYFDSQCSYVWKWIQPSILEWNTLMFKFIIFETWWKIEMRSWRNLSLGECYRCIEKPCNQRKN